VKKCKLGKSSENPFPDFLKANDGVYLDGENLEDLELVQMLDKILLKISYFNRN